MSDFLRTGFYALVFIGYGFSIYHLWTNQISLGDQIVLTLTAVCMAVEALKRFMKKEI